MKEAYGLYRAIPGDILLVMCLFIGALARLTRDEAISIWTAAKEFYYSLVVGAVITGFAVWLSGWGLKSAWWIALAAPMGCSMVVEIVHKKAEQIRDMNMTETITFVFDEIQKRLKKQAE